MDCICVVVDHFSKMVHLVPCLTSMNATEFADRRQVFRLHGCTRHIVSDRGTQFTAEFWRQFCKDMGMRLRMSSDYQPSTDGQVERYNQTLEEMLRSFVNECMTIGTCGWIVRSSQSIKPRLRRMGVHPSTWFMCTHLCCLRMLCFSRDCL